jgi:hypothetical protein
MKRIRKLLLELTGRRLTEVEADMIRGQVVAMNPKLHAVLADWPWVEIRGTNEQAEARLLKVLGELPGVRVRILERE